MSQPPSTVLPTLARVLERRSTPAGRRWIERALAPSAAEDTLADVFTEATRRLGRAPLDMAPHDRDELRSAGLYHADADELGRIALLVRAAASFDEARSGALIEACYRRGDTRERQAVLRALPVLPPAGVLVDVGVDACRSSVQPIFEAIACENPFPARHFPELNFNQMVLKALFTDVRLARIVGLDGRLTVELARMATAYASERRAAGRSVPPDIDRLTVAPQEADR